MPRERSSVCLLALASWALAGCGLVLETDLVPAPGPSVDGGPQQSVDASEAPDGAPTTDGALLDGGAFDGPVTGDASFSDGPMSSLAEHQVFVTSTVHDANLAGLSGADALCQALASTSGVDGSFKAILSDSTTSARERLPLRGRIVRMDGTLVATGPGDLWDGTILATINVTETNAEVTDSNVWTGTDADGVRDRAGGYCNDWGSLGDPEGGAEAGQTDRTDMGWISLYGTGPMSIHACSTTSRLYCIRVD